MVKHLLAVLIPSITVGCFEFSHQSYDKEDNSLYSHRYKVPDYSVVHVEWVIYRVYIITELLKHLYKYLVQCELNNT